MDWRQLWDIASAPDNVPIVALIPLLFFYIYLAWKQAKANDELVGELAADPLATPLLLGLGLEEFSVSAALIPDLKQSIGRWSLPDAQAIAAEMLRLDSSEEARRCAASARFQPRP